MSFPGFFVNIYFAFERVERKIVKQFIVNKSKLFQFVLCDLKSSV